MKTFKPDLKKKCNRTHARKRAIQRFGLRFTNRNLKEIEQLIRDGKSTFYRKTSCTRSVHQVTYNGEVFRAVYDKHRKCLVTVF